MLSAPPFLQPLLTTPVAVLGSGVSGQGAAELIRRLGGEVVIYDQQSAAGTESTFRVAGHQLVLVSPGFGLDHPWVIAARSAGVICLNELDLASLFWRGSVVAMKSARSCTPTPGSG